MYEPKIPEGPIVGIPRSYKHDLAAGDFIAHEGAMRTFLCFFQADKK
jgi:hypothetical protein